MASPTLNKPEAPPSASALTRQRRVTIPRTAARQAARPSNHQDVPPDFQMLLTVALNIQAAMWQVKLQQDAAKAG